jgi:hypothetical protein
MIHATSIHQRSSERSCLPSWTHTRACQGAGWDVSISPFFSSWREPAQVSYIGICRGRPARWQAYGRTGEGKEDLLPRRTADLRRRQHREASGRLPISRWRVAVGIACMIVEYFRLTPINCWILARSIVRLSTIFSNGAK